MDSLENLFGGNQQQQQSPMQDVLSFVNRYEQGHPSEGYSDEEVMQRYNQVAPQLSQGDYMQAAQQAFERMSPQERQQFGQFVEQQAQAQGINVPGGGQGNYTDPSYLAQMTGQMHQQQPGMLGQLLGGVLGGGSGSGTSGGSSGGMLSNPVAKAAMAGIAAMAVKKVMGNRGL